MTGVQTCALPISQDLELGSKVKKRKKVYEPIRDANAVKEFFDFKKEKLGQLNPLVLDNPTSFLEKEGEGEGEGEGEDEDEDVEVGLLGSTCLRWVFLSLRFFCLDCLCSIFGLIWYFGALGYDDFAGFQKMVILRFLIFGF